MSRMTNEELIEEYAFGTLNACVTEVFSVAIENADEDELLRAHGRIDERLRELEFEKTQVRRTSPTSPLPRKED